MRKTSHWITRSKSNCVSKRLWMRPIRLLTSIPKRAMSLASCRLGTSPPVRGDCKEASEQDCDLSWLCRGAVLLGSLTRLLEDLSSLQPRGWRSQVLAVRVSPPAAGAFPPPGHQLRLGTYRDVQGRTAQDLRIENESLKWYRDFWPHFICYTDQP